MALRSLVRRLGHRQWFSDLTRFLMPVDRLLGRLTNGRVVALRLLPSLLITTTGRRSGQPRTNPLAYARDGDSFVVIGSNWGRTQHPAWSTNLLASPDATVNVDGRVVRIRATLAEGAERDRLWRLLLAMWPAYATYEQRAAGRHLRIFRLDPVA